MSAADVLAQAGVWLAAFVVGGLIGLTLRRAARRWANRRRPVRTDDVVVDGQLVGVLKIEGRVSEAEAQRIRRASIVSNRGRNRIGLLMAGHVLTDLCRYLDVDVDAVESMDVRHNVRRRGEWDITVTLQTGGAPYQRGLHRPRSLVPERVVTAPTPADVAPVSARLRPVWFFDHHRADPAVPETLAQRRARLRDDVFTNAERFLAAARGLRCREEDLDLALELYSRALSRLDAATGAFDYELGKTTTPTPHVQHCTP